MYRSIPKTSKRQELFPKLKEIGHKISKENCGALQQNSEQVAQAYFEIWTIEVGIGVKNDSPVKLEVLVCFFFCTVPSYVFYHRHIIYD